MPESIALYEPFRVIGLVSDDIPFVMQKLGDETFLYTVVGNCFQIFKTDRLVVCLVSRPAPGKINALQVSGQSTYVAVGNKVYKYERTRIVKTVTTLPETILGLSMVGNILLAWDTSNKVHIINILQDEVIGELTLLQKSTITKVIHPSSYVNKFVFAFADGTLQLWNINSRKLIYEFTGLETKIFDRIPNPADREITCLGQSPACDILGIGFASGDIVLFNLKLDLFIFHFKQRSAVTSIAFRSDAQTDRYPYFVTGSQEGHFYTWTIGGSVIDPSKVEPRLIFHTLQAHDQRITHLDFLPGEPVLVTAGADNTIKEWIYDQPDGSPRLLRFRQGHSVHPSLIRYFGDATMAAEYGSEIVSMMNGIVSLDEQGSLFFSRLEKHGFLEPFSHQNVLKEQHKHTQKQQQHSRRLTKCTAFAMTYVGAKTWGSLVSLHAHQTTGYVWKVDDHAITTTRLLLPDYYTKKVTHSHTVFVTNCGHYAVIGYAHGLIGKFNIQSGLFRGTFPAILDKFYEKSDNNQTTNGVGSAGGVGLKECENVALRTAHASDITGLFVDITNTTLVSIGQDGKLCFWSFQTNICLHSVQHSTALISLHGHFETNFVSIATAEHDILVYDLITYRVIRVFRQAHTAAITDMTFSMDGKRLLSTSSDGTFRVWDMKTGRCLSWMQFPAGITSCTIGHHGDVLIAQAGIRGITVCVDRSLSEFIAFNEEPSSPVKVSNASQVVFPTATDETEVAEDVPTSDKYVSTLDKSGQEGAGSPISVVDGYIFSQLPKAYWTTICNLELIKRRNRLITAKPTETIPFLLQNAVAMNVKTSTVMDPTNVAGKGQAVPSKLLTATTVFTPHQDDNTGKEDTTTITKKNGSSRIIRKSLVPRSKFAMLLHDLLLTSTPSIPTGSTSTSHILPPHTFSSSSITTTATTTTNTAITTAATRSSPTIQVDAFPQLTRYLFSLTPSEIDIEFRGLLPPSATATASALNNSLSSNNDTPYYASIHSLMYYFVHALQSNTAFEVIQAYIYRFLLIYSATMMETVAWKGAIGALREEVSASQQRLQLVIQLTLSVLKTILNMPTS